MGRTHYKVCYCNMVDHPQHCGDCNYESAGGGRGNRGVPVFPVLTWEHKSKEREFDKVETVQASSNKARVLGSMLIGSCERVGALGRRLYSVPARQRVGTRRLRQRIYNITALLSTNTCT